MDFLPKHESDLATKDYWKSFFEYEAFKEGFEWYADFKDLMPYLQQYITSKDQKILVPGCGNSDLSEKICTKLGLDGISVDSFDYADTIVEQMQEKSPKDLNLVFRVGDATNLSGVYEDA